MGWNDYAIAGCRDHADFFVECCRIFVSCTLSHVFFKGSNMSVVYILVPLGLFLSGCGLFAFLWAVRRGQMDDTQTPAIRILFSDEEKLSKDHEL